jgi:GDP-L-fucose synthase
MTPVATNFWTGRRVVVTGGTGFLGSFITRQLLASGAHVAALGRGDYDLVEQADVRRMYVDLRPEVVVHAAAACGGIGANLANPGHFLHANAAMGLHLIEEARRHGSPRFILISTTCAYPEAAPIPLREATLEDGPPTAVTGPYGLAKRLLHTALASFHRQYGLPGVVLIPANLYGPGDHFEPENSHVIAGLIRRFVEATEQGAASVTCWGTGTPTREFLHVSDAARAVALVGARAQDPSPINLGTGVETPIRGLAEQIAQAAGFKGEILWDPSKPDGQPRRSLDVARARALGFSAEIALEVGLAETVAWFRGRR